MVRKSPHTNHLSLTGLKHPWNCPVCTFSNASFPSLCEVCDTKNPTYADALGALNREKGEFKCKAECTAECTAKYATFWSTLRKTKCAAQYAAKQTAFLSAIK